MAVDFDGTTSGILNTTAVIPVTLGTTICAWALAQSAGEGNGGTILVIDETRSFVGLDHTTAWGTLHLRYTFSGTSGEWTFPADEWQWNAISVSYDGLAANDPIVRVNFADVTVTETVAPVGTLTPPAAGGYSVGNRSDGTQAWDGMLQHVMFFNTVLTSAQQDQALKNPAGPLTAALQLWHPIRNAAEVNDLSTNGFLGTPTGLTESGVQNPPIGVLKKMIYYHAAG